MKHIPEPVQKFDQVDVLLVMLFLLVACALIWPGPTFFAALWSVLFGI